MFSIQMTCPSLTLPCRLLHGVVWQLPCQLTSPPRKSTLSTYPFKDQVALSFSLFNNNNNKLSPFQFSIPILIIYNIKNINDGYLERLISGPTCIVMDVDGWTGNFKSNHMTWYKGSCHSLSWAFLSTRILLMRVDLRSHGREMITSESPHSD